MTGSQISSGSSVGHPPQQEPYSPKETGFLHLIDPLDVWGPPCSCSNAYSSKARRLATGSPALTRPFRPINLLFPELPGCCGRWTWKHPTTLSALKEGAAKSWGCLWEGAHISSPAWWTRDWGVGSRHSRGLGPNRGGIQGSTLSRHRGQVAHRALHGSGQKLRSLASGDSWEFGLV